MDDQARIFDDYDEFRATTGLIDEDEKLEAIGATHVHRQTGQRQILHVAAR